MNYSAYTIDELLRLLPAHRLEKRPDGSYEAKWYGQIGSQADFVAILTLDAHVTVVIGGTSEIRTHSRTSAAHALSRLASALTYACVLLGEE